MSSSIATLSKQINLLNAPIYFEELGHLPRSSIHMKRYGSNIFSFFKFPSSFCSNKQQMHDFSV